AALALSVRRTERGASLLGLAPGGRRPLVLPAALTVCVCGCLAVAAAQPALRTTHRQTVRTQSQVSFVVDVSRSMSAAPSLPSLGRDGFFDRTARTRTCVLVSDGETRSYSAADAVRSLGCRLIAVRVGGANEHVFGPDGSPEAGYVPDPAAGANMQQLAEAA